MKEENTDPGQATYDKEKAAQLPVPTMDEIQKYVELTKCFERSPLEV